MTKRKIVNQGEHPMFHAEETHEAIVSIETFDAVQAEITRRAARFKNQQPARLHTRFVGKSFAAHAAETIIGKKRMPAQSGLAEGSTHLVNLPALQSVYRKIP